MFSDSLQKIYYCPLKDNRQVDETGGTALYRRVDSLVQSHQEAKLHVPVGRTIQSIEARPVILFSID